MINIGHEEFTCMIDKEKNCLVWKKVSEKKGNHWDDVVRNSLIKKTKGLQFLKYLSRIIEKVGNSKRKYETEV